MPQKTTSTLFKPGSTDFPEKKLTLNTQCTVGYVDFKAASWGFKSLPVLSLIRLADVRLSEVSFFRNVLTLFLLVSFLFVDRVSFMATT